MIWPVPGKTSFAGCKNLHLFNGFFMDNLHRHSMIRFSDESQLPMLTFAIWQIYNQGKIAGEGDDASEGTG
jgi:hypothetical protein